MASWRDRITIHVELGIRGTAAGNGVWDESEWDSAATWSGIEPTFVEVDGCEVASVTVERGRKDGKSRHATGTAELALVWPAPGPDARWSFRPTSPVQLGQELRVRASVDGTDLVVPVFRGAVRSITDVWTPDGPFRVVARLTDRAAELAAVDLPESAAAGLDDLTHERVLRILELASIPEARASMGTDADDSGTVHHQSSNFARNLLDEAWSTVESDAGTDLVVNRDGVFELRRREWWLPREPGSVAHPRWNTTRVTWTNLGTLAELEPAEYSPTGFGTGQDLDDVQNHVSMARAGGSAITVEDTDSIIRYGLRTHQRMDLTCRYDADVTTAAELRLDQLKEHTDRIEAIISTIDPYRSTDDLALWLDLELGDQHAIEWSDGAGTLAGVFHVQGLRHQIDGTTWQQTVNLWAYAGLGLEPVAEPVWGSAIWGESTWQAG